MANQIREKLKETFKKAFPWLLVPLVGVGSYFAGMENYTPAKLSVHNNVAPPYESTWLLTNYLQNYHVPEKKDGTSYRVHPQGHIFYASKGDSYGDGFKYELTKERKEHLSLYIGGIPIYINSNAEQGVYDVNIGGGLSDLERISLDHLDNQDNIASIEFNENKIDNSWFNHAEKILKKFRARFSEQIPDKWQLEKEKK